MNVQDDLFIVKEGAETFSGCSFAPERGVELPMEVDIKEDCHFVISQEPLEDGDVSLFINEEVDIKENLHFDIPEEDKCLGMDLLQEQGNGQKLDGTGKDAESNLLHSCQFGVHLKKGIKFLCDICSEAFPENRDLRRHILTHTGERKYKCNMCSKSFALNSNLKKHLLRNLKVEQESNDASNDSNVGVANLRGLTRVSSILGERCIPSVNKIIVKTEEMDAEEQETNGIPASQVDVDHNVKNLVGSSIKAFDSKNDLASHINLVHLIKGKYQHEFRTKNFQFLSKLIIHKSSHTAERPFKCVICLKGFVQKMQIKRHILSHAEERPHRCGKFHQFLSAYDSLVCRPE
ncbi:zinc finger protein 431-like [Hetaerina americana]|uniref:zinc finger protein 431-like n=1 Tax=Hetaerina americana TaxID=62018 RepID=UPI003A7F53FF